MKSVLISGACLSLAVAVAPLFGAAELPGWSVRLGWTLVHSTWQIAAIAAIAFVMNIGLSHRSPNVRYLCSIVALVSTLIVPCITWSLIVVPAPMLVQPPVVVSSVVEKNAPAAADQADSAIGMTGEPGVAPRLNSNQLAEPQHVIRSHEMKSISAEPIPATQASIAERPKSTMEPVPPFGDRMRPAIRPWLGFINAFWLAGVLLLSIRPVWGLWMQFRLRRVGLSDLSEELQLRLQLLAERMGVTRAVRVAVSALVKVPMVVGYLRPMILLPASVIIGLSPAEMDALLAHELAHIRRHDWIVNALQVVVETLLFYHPAVWWLSYRIRHERELCCDDLALTLIPDKAKYGRMLLVLEELLHHSPSPALAATGGDLLFRIRRLVPSAKPSKHSFNGWFAALALLSLFAITGGLSILSAQQSPTEKEKNKTDEPQTKGKQPSKDDVSPKPTNDSGTSPARDASGETSAPLPKSGVIAIAAHDREYNDPIIDLTTMTVNESYWYTSVPFTLLSKDRWLRSRGYGDLSRSEDGTWTGFRGAVLLVLEQEELEEAAQLPVNQLKSRIVAEGKIQVSEDDFGVLQCLAILAGSGHVYVGKLSSPFPWSVKFDVRRLTDDSNGYRGRPNDGVEFPAWGPVVDGLQAGIVYRTPNPKPGARLMIGDMIAVKLFVRNAGKDEKTYSWQMDDEFHFLDHDEEEKAKRTLPGLPILRTWQPILVDAAGQPATISPIPDHLSFKHHTVKLKPGESVFVGAAASSLWSQVDVDFGVAGDRLNSVEVAPGEYRLSTLLDTGLVSSPKLLTGELTLQVVETDPVRSKLYAALDALPASRRHHSDEKYWTDSREKGNAAPDENLLPPGPPVARPNRGNPPLEIAEEVLEVADDAPPKPSGRQILGRDPVAYLMLPGFVYDEETKKPVEGVVITLMIQAYSHGHVPELCRYLLTSDAKGRFEARIPRKLLSGYAPNFKGQIYFIVRHPTYSGTFVYDEINKLQTLGVISKDGIILKQGEVPAGPRGTSGEPDQLEIQQIALKAGRAVSGRLLGPESKPLTNARITGQAMTPYGFGDMPVVAHTDSEGRFRLNVSAKATVRIEFEAPGLPEIEVKALPEQTELGDVLAAQGMRIRGRVLNALGKPIAHVSMTAPPVPRESGVSVTIFRTDELGQFESVLLSPGEYQLVVGDVDPPDERSPDGVRISGPPPDLYLPYRFKVESGVPLPDVTMKPELTTTITATLISTAVTNEKTTDAIDVMLLKAALAKPLTVKFNGVDASQPRDPEFKVTVDPNTGTYSVKGDTDNEVATALSFLGEQVPYFTVQGKLNGEPWSGYTNYGSLEQPDESSDQGDRPKRDPNVISLKVPRQLEDLTITTGYSLGHVQIGAGPRLFGSAFRIPKVGADPLELKLYYYKATTLRIRLRDADGKLIAMADDKPPEGISIKGRLVREDEIRKAGAIFEHPEQETHVIQDNEEFIFTIPGEAFEITVTANGKSYSRQFTLKDGETRTAELKLGSAEWTETSKPTPKVEIAE